MPRRSIRYPLALGITLMVLALALGIAWQVIVVRGWRPATGGLTAAHWVAIVLGSLVALTIFVGLLLLCIWLVREIRFGQRQQSFIDAVTHEMKTPIASLQLYLDTLQRRELPPERQRAFFGRMQEDVERLVGEGEKFRQADDMRRELAELKNQAETLLYTTGAALEGYADLVDGEVLDAARQQAARLRELLDSASDIALIREAHQGLEAMVFAIAEKMYGAAGDEADPADGGEPQE